jgi:hypothetical protein
MGQEGSGDGINYNYEDGRQRHRREGADNKDKQQKQLFDSTR